MTAIFNYDKVEKVNLKHGQWVRIKGGLYEGDLAKVIEVEDPITRIHIKLVPRLGENSTAGKFEKKGNIKKSVRPRQKLFNYKDYDNVDTDKLKFQQKEIYNKMTFQNGFLVKVVRAKSLIVENVVPKIDELRIFEFEKRDDEDEDNYNLLSKLREADLNKKRVFNRGDKVKIIKGGLANVTGTVESMQENLVELKVDIDGYNEVLEYSTDFLVKHFLPGDHVRVSKS